MDGRGNHQQVLMLLILTIIGLTCSNLSLEIMYDKITTTGNILLTVGRIPTSRQILVPLPLGSTFLAGFGLANNTQALVSGRRRPSLFGTVFVAHTTVPCKTHHVQRILARMLR